jgi:hypothetical protein
VDPELLEVLELADDEQLEEIYALLTGTPPPPAAAPAAPASSRRPPTPDRLGSRHRQPACLPTAASFQFQPLPPPAAGRSLFSPLLKSLVAERDGVAAAVSGREALIQRIDHRLRWLAADAGATLKGQWPAYRSVLLSICDKLGVRCSRSLLTNELEAEVFLHLLEQHSDTVAGTGDAGAQGQQAAAAEFAQAGDGGAAASQQQRAARGRPNLVQRLLAPLRLGQEEVMPALARLGSAVAVSNLQREMLQRLGMGLMRSHLRYDAALHLAFSAGAKGVQGRVAVQVREGWGRVRGLIGGMSGCFEPQAAPASYGTMPFLPATLSQQIQPNHPLSAELLPACLPAPACRRPRKGSQRLPHDTPRPAPCWACWAPWSGPAPPLTCSRCPSAQTGHASSRPCLPWHRSACCAHMASPQGPAAAAAPWAPWAAPAWMAAWAAMAAAERQMP